ncbi:hypothetical protein CGRA01v4_12753 [Colletotrichum graminicola]|nr:hypothetical protein CGRA01v4_12753 [Colletotrichum graminicola]
MGSRCPEEWHGSGAEERPRMQPVPHRIRFPAGSRRSIRPRRAAGVPKPASSENGNRGSHSLAGLSRSSFPWNRCSSGPTRTPPTTEFHHPKPQHFKGALAILPTTSE